MSPWAYWMAELSRVRHCDPVPDDDSDLEAWRQRCRARLIELLGPWPEPVEPRVEILTSVECASYRRDKVVFDSERNMSVPAYILVPHGRDRPGPGVLACHGHGPGKDLVCGLVETDAPEGDYAHQLALRGYVVLAPDLRCFGERQDWMPPDHYACDTNLVHAFMAGVCPLTQNLWDLARCLDLLADHPLVDPSRLGVVGLSYGATVAIFLAALDERVAVTVASGYLSSWAEAHKMPWNMCGSQVLWGMLGRLEHVDVAAQIAPRALLVQSGTEDLLFPVAAARQTLEQLRRVWAGLGAPEALGHDVFEGGHRWRGEAVYPFLERWLGSGKHS